ncbi:hypothetical protein B566_EDAN004069 [Ephemera danica]|nr:hypothetical protein B566_EDAN004069 [Ephemera danica]
MSEERSDTSMDHNHLDAGSVPLQPPLPVISGSRKPTTSINRSESYKERAQKRQLRERRKTSDPNLSKSTDVDADGSGLQYNNNSGSSSNSTQSLRSLDSPSNSLEMVTGVTSVTSRLLDPATPLPQASSDDGLDSDMEAEPDPPDWTRLVSEAELKQLSPREKKRQEVINELFHTERSHVRALRVLDQVFYRPLCESHILPSEQIALLFPNLNSMLEIHSGFNNAMKARRKETPLVGDISDMLLNMFDGPAGEEFQREAATFCAKQQFALEALKEKRRKDQKLNNFLTEAEGNPLCRRLQLKDIIPTGMLRLTKYPLLFDNLVKLCEPGSTERAGVQRALDRSKEILNHVNQAVREAEDLHRLAEIHKRLDKTSFDKTEHAIAIEFKHLDLTRHRLVFEGALSWRQSKGQKSMELHVVLLEEMIMLLQKQDDKFVLKFHNAGGQDSKNLYSPLIKFSTVLIRPVATDKKAFFLVNTSASNAQIYELVALSSSERKTWFRHISEAADAYKMREGRARRPDLMPVPILPTPADTSNDAGSEDKEAGESAAAATEQGGASSNPSAPAAPERMDSGFQEGNAETGPSSSSALPSDSSPEDSSKKTGASPGLVRRSSSGRSSGSCELTRLTQEAPLIQPSEVVVCRRDVLLAEPVLTPIERLRREDEAIALALRRKQEIVAELLHIPRDQFETIADLATTRLTNLLNESLRVSEEETRVSKERDEERELLRREAQRLREQVHAMHEQRRTGSSKPKRRATATGLSSTSPDLSSSEYKSSEEVDTLPAEHSLEVAEPSQEEFVDALCGDGAGGSSTAISQDDAGPGDEDATSPNH